MIFQDFIFSIPFLFMLISLPTAFSSANNETATFAGGCFWCMEHPFDEQPGVISVVSGYTGGHTANPTYEEVCSGDSGHLEAVQIIYNPSEITYEKLLDIFWRQIDPTDNGGQFVDRGTQYKTAIFYHNPTQKNLAEQSRKNLNSSGKFGKPIVTEIREAGAFYKAEDYHQNFYKTCPAKYKNYRNVSGRDQYISKIWNIKDIEDFSKNLEQFRKPEKTKLLKTLTPEQYHVTQENGTERPFKNEFWNNSNDGIYVDIVSGEPLFSSLDKFDSGCGWPSFSKPLDKSYIIEKEDYSLPEKRTEVRSRKADSHLGHVFGDGPGPTGLRYCINSAAVRFIPKENLEKEGYGRYKILFDK